MEVYKSKKESYSAQLNTINKKYNSISFFRLLTIVLFLVSIYYYIQTSEVVLIILAVLLFGSFILLMRFHSKLSFQKQIFIALIEINENEISYLERKKIPFENGQEFNDFHHPYAYDLDIFGEHSLFQNLNRTATFIGKKTLAKQLLTLLPNEEILKNHKAIKELSEKLDWRQEFLAFAKISQDTKSSYETLLKWSKFESTPLSKATVLISYISPVLFFGVFIAYLVTSKPVFVSYLAYLFVFNLAFMGRFLRRIQIEIANAENVDKIINQYSLLVQKIEKETFESQKLIDLQQKLTYQKRKRQCSSETIGCFIFENGQYWKFCNRISIQRNFSF